MENKLILNSTELTGILGKGEIEKLSVVVEKNAWLEYRQKYDLASNLTILDYPIQLDFELNASCNLKCPMCYTISDSFKKLVNTKRMEWDLFKKIIDEIAFKVPAIRLSLRGEATLNKNFAECIKYAKDNGIKEVSTLTHGFKLTLPFFKKIVDAGIDWITISIDGVGEKYIPSFNMNQESEHSSQMRWLMAHSWVLAIALITAPKSLSETLSNTIVLGQSASFSCETFDHRREFRKGAKLVFTEATTKAAFMGKTFSSSRKKTTTTPAQAFKTHTAFYQIKIFSAFLDTAGQQASKTYFR